MERGTSAAWPPCSRCTGHRTSNNQTPSFAPQQPCGAATYVQKKMNCMLDTFTMLSSIVDVLSHSSTDWRSTPATIHREIKDAYESLSRETGKRIRKSRTTVATGAKMAPYGSKMLENIQRAAGSTKPSASRCDSTEEFFGSRWTKKTGEKTDITVTRNYLQPAHQLAPM